MTSHSDPARIPSSAPRDNIFVLLTTLETVFERKARPVTGKSIGSMSPQQLDEHRNWLRENPPRRLAGIINELGSMHSEEPDMMRIRRALSGLLEDLLRIPETGAVDEKIASQMATFHFSLDSVLENIYILRGLINTQKSTPPTAAGTRAMSRRVNDTLMGGGSE